MDIFDIQNIVEVGAMLYAFLKEYNILKKEKKCERCDEQCKVVKLKEGYRFICNICRRRYTAYNISIMSNMISITKILYVIFFFEWFKYRASMKYCRN